MSRVYLRECETSFGGKVDLVVLEISKLDGHEKTVFALGPLYFGEEANING